MSLDGNPISIVIAGGYLMFREALRTILDAETDFSVVGGAADFEETIEQVKDSNPAILLLDFPMPSPPPVDVLRSLMNSERPRTILLTDSASRIQTIEALTLGACGILSKQASTALLFKSIRAVAVGEFWIGHEHIRDLLTHLRAGNDHFEARHSAAATELTPREKEIVAGIIDGASNKEIARTLSISEQTVKHHLTSIFAKRGVSNRLELALLAMQDQLATRNS